jgi:hypothetical protein
VWHTTKGKQTYRLLGPERVELERGKRRGYLIDRESRRMSLKDIWYLWCEATGWPYLVVIPARRYARVELDFICTHRRLPLAAIDELFERAVRDFPEWRGNIADMFSHARVLLENANGFARLMLDMARRAEPEWFLRTEEIAEQARLNATSGFYTSDRERTVC